MKIPRILTKKIEKAIQPGKVVVLYGPRRAGKTTLLGEITRTRGSQNYFKIDADKLRFRRVLSSQDERQIKSLVAGKKLLIVDEAQRVENIGLNLKIIVDNFPKLSVLVTGSASLDLASEVGEPLTGRKKTFMLYPISYGELVNWLGFFEVKSQLERWLVFGSYPEVLLIESQEAREDYLSELISGYLYKDVLEFGGIKKSEKIVDLLRLLAFQIGREVSVAELASNLAIDRVTVEKYLDLLEKAFVIFKVGGFSRNLRKEIAKTSRYYFYDNGVRNALIENFNELALRDDKGQLWENFLVVERRKTNQYTGRRVNNYFWRTYDQKEIDLIEEREGKLFGFEFKWQGEMKKSARKEFLKVYPGSELKTITCDNFEEFL